MGLPRNSLITWLFLCPACRTYLITTRFWVVLICPIIKCLTVLEFSFILFDLCLFITIFNFILNYVPIVTFWIFTYHKIWILLIIFCFIWNYWIINFLTCLEVFWGKDSRKTVRESFKCWDLVRLILETWRHFPWNVPGFARWGLIVVLFATVYRFSMIMYLPYWNTCSPL